MTRPPPRAPKPLIRRDAEGRERTAPSWETLDRAAHPRGPGVGRLRRPAGTGPAACRSKTSATPATWPWPTTSCAMLAPHPRGSRPTRRSAGRSTLIEALLAQAARSAAGAGPRLERELDRLADTYDDVRASPGGNGSNRSAAADPPRSRDLAQATARRADGRPSMNDASPMEADLLACGLVITLEIDRPPQWSSTDGHDRLPRTGARRLAGGRLVRRQPLGRQPPGPTGLQRGAPPTASGLRSVPSR